MKPRAPQKGTWTIAFILGVLALLSRYVIKIPIVSNYEFELLALSFVMLVLGTLFKGF